MRENEGKRSLLFQFAIENRHIERGAAIGAGAKCGSGLSLPPIARKPEDKDDHNGGQNAPYHPFSTHTPWWFPFGHSIFSLKNNRRKSA